MVILTKERACRLATALTWGLAGCIVLAQPVRAGVVIDGTRVIYPSGRREVSVNLHNVGDAPSLVQAWIETSDEKAGAESTKIPFALTPPLFRIDPTKGQTLRLIYTREPLPADRETVFWLNVLDIPPRAMASPDAPNRLELAFRHRLKLFFRPAGLPGNPAAAAAAVTWSVAWRGGSTALEARNPTPYYVSFTGLDLRVGTTVESVRAAMLPPFSSQQFALSRPDTRLSGQITIRYEFVNDFGAVENGEATVGTAS